MLGTYLIAFGGALGGMFLTILVQSEIINRSEKFTAGFNDAFKFYTTTNRGGLYVGAMVVFLFLYLIPNLISSDAKVFENFLENLRFWSIGLGIVSQALGFLAVKKSHQKLDEVDKKD
jgi:hypothetical protein